MLDHRIDTFLAAYEGGSFTRAARALHISQPAVSQHIRYLEHAYGCELFTKDGRRILPTAAADLLYQSMLTMRNDEQRLTVAMETAGVRPRRLRVGATRTVSTYVMPDLFVGMLDRHTDETPSLSVGNTRELTESILAGNLDCALVEGSYDRDLFEGEVFSRERAIAICAPGANPPASLEDLMARTLILRERGSGTREILERILAVQNLSLTDAARVVEVGEISVIKHAVECGRGVSFLYRIAVQNGLDRGTLVDCTPPELACEHDFTLIWQRGSLMRRRCQALLREWRTVSG